MIDKEPLYNIGMKDLSDFVVLHDGRFWIDTECDDGAPPFDVGVPFKFTIDSVTQIGVVNCDDGVNAVRLVRLNSYRPSAAMIDANDKFGIS